MSSFWTAVVAITCLCMPTTCTFVPKFLDGDLTSLLAHFKIKHLTNVHNSKIDFGAAHELASAKGEAGELSVFVDSVSCAEVTLSRPRVGAVFYPAAQSEQACSADVTRELIQESSYQRPFFLFSPTETSAPRWLHDVYIPFNTSVYLILRHLQEPNSLTLQEVYHLEEQREQLLTNVLGQRKHFDPKITEDKSSEDEIRWRWFMREAQVMRRANLMGTAIQVTYPESEMVEKSPMIDILKSFDKSFHIVMQHINASVRRIYFSDWYSLRPALEARQADMGFFPTVLKENYSAVDVSSPYEVVSSRLYIRKPSFTYSLSTVLHTFTLRTWAASCALLLALTITLAVISHVSHEFGGDSQPPFTFSEGILLALGNICLQGWERLPGSASGRVLGVASITAGLLLNAYFVSQLQAGLLSSTPTLPFRSFEELLKTDYRVFVDKNSSAYAYIQNTRADLIKEVRKTLIYNSTTEEVGVCENRVAFLSSFLTPFNCSVVDTQVDEFRRWIGVPMVKNFRFKRLINHSVRRMVEGGLVQRGKAAVRRRAQVAAHKDEDSFEQIEFAKVEPFLRIYGFSLVIVVAIFVLELACSLVRERRGSWQ